MIFLVGVRRSGTNWLQRVLCAHPAAAAVPGETYLFSHGLAPLAERFQHAAPGLARVGSVYFDRQASLDAMRDLCDRVFGGLLSSFGGSAERLVERTPDHVRHLRLIGSVYPDAHVVHIVRDGRDVARSLVSQPWGPATLTEAAQEWRSGVEAARRDAAGLARYHEVRYEELLAFPRQRVAALFGALGLDAHETILAGALAAVAAPVAMDPSGPAPAAARWRAEMSPGELAQVEAVAGPLLVELGYELAGGATPWAPAAEATPAAPGAARTSPGAPPERRRRAAGAANALARRWPTRRGVPFERAVRDRLMGLTEVFHRLVGALAQQDEPALGAVLAGDVAVRVVVAGEAWEATGPGAVARLAEALRSDPALAGRQVRGDVYPAVPTCVLVATFQSDDGALHDRVLAATTYGATVAALTWYVWPGRLARPGMAEPS